MDRPGPRVLRTVLVPAGDPDHRGAGLAKGADLLQTGFQGYAIEFFWGFVASAISGFVVIWFLLGYLRRHTFKAFMWYRLAVAGLIVVLIVSGARSATI